MGLHFTTGRDQARKEGRREGIEVGAHESRLGISRIIATNLPLHRRGPPPSWEGILAGPRVSYVRIPAGFQLMTGSRVGPFQ